jgi:hypothetical protein
MTALRNPRMAATGQVKRMRVSRDGLPPFGGHWSTRFAACQDSRNADLSGTRKQGWVGEPPRIAPAANLRHPGVGRELIHDSALG